MQIAILQIALSLEHSETFELASMGEVSIYLSSSCKTQGSTAHPFSVSHTMMHPDKASRINSRAQTPGLRQLPRLRWADAKTAPDCLADDGCLPSALLHNPLDGPWLCRCLLGRPVCVVTGSPRTAVRFGLPLMSGTPGAVTSSEGG